MSDPEIRKPQRSDPQKPEEKKPVTQPNMPAPPKQEITERTAQNSAAGARET